MKVNTTSEMNEQSSAVVAIAASSTIGTLLEQTLTCCVDDEDLQLNLNYLRPTSQALPALPPADLHIVILDGHELKPQALIEALLKRYDTCPVQRLLLLGWWHEAGDAWDPHGGTSELSDEGVTVDAQPWLRLLFEGFKVRYERLPLSGRDVLDAARRALADDAGGDWGWGRDWQRMTVALTHLGQARNDPIDGDVPVDSDMSINAWQDLESCCGSIANRLHQEHDSIDATKLLRYQWVLDHYYLATARESSYSPRTFLMVEDRLGKADEAPTSLRTDLELLARATGDRFYVTQDFQVCLAVHDWFASRRDRPESEDESLLSDAWFERIGSDPDEERMVNFSETVLDRAPVLKIGPDMHQAIRVDAILVDLLLRGDRDQPVLNGEEIVQHLTDRFPGVPVLVVTKSEEPDVLARCVKIRGADGVIPKRRLLRLPHTYRSYLREVSPLLPVLQRAGLDSAMIRLYRIWTRDPDILWNGDKTFHGAEHRLVHHMNLWRMANHLLARTWPDVRKCTLRLLEEKLAGRLPATPEQVLFCFFGSIWLHDVGLKGDDVYNTADEVRHRHAFLSGKLIRHHPEAYGLKGIDKDLIEAIAVLSQYHQSNSPLETLDECSGKPTEGLFKHPMRQCAPSLLPWEALLRLLDSAEHHWKRVGSPQLTESKRVTLANDKLYHAEKGKRGWGDAQDYAKWLGKQPEHLEKHRSVLDVQVSTEWDGERELWNLYFWFAFEKQGYQDYFGMIARYVLTECWETGHYLPQLGLTIPRKAPQVEFPSTPWIYYPVWDAPKIRTRQKEVNNQQQGTKDEIARLAEEFSDSETRFEKEEVLEWLKQARP